jgi:hypothetical protein
MRRLLSACALVLLVAGLACAPGRSSGSLWALDEAHLEEEMVYRTPDPVRAAQARQYQLQAADDVLAADQARLDGLLSSCPEPRQDRLRPSPAARARDGVRARQESDRTARATQLAAADWYLRRAAVTGEPGLCERARQALSQSQPSSPQASPDLPAGEVERDPPGAEVGDGAASPYQALRLYGLGLIDAVRGPAPLIGDLAVVFGGALRIAADPSASPEEVVDRLAPSLSWEPDGLYLALRAQR